jgi:hypothetical protein
MSFFKKLINKKEKETITPPKPQDEQDVNSGFADSFTIGNGVKPKERIIAFPKLDDDTSDDTLGGFNLITNFIANVISTHLIYSEIEVKNILTDMEKMPDCAEKILMNLIYLCSLERLPDLQKSGEKINILDFDFTNEMKVLHERLNKEEINSEKIKEKYEKIQKSLESKEFKLALMQLKEFFQAIRDINIQELLRLTSSNEKSIKLIKDKNVNMLMGLTGSGQKTTLHFLGGSKMVVKQIDEQDIIVPEEINNIYLKDVTSETRNITPVFIELDKDKGFSEETVIFCNTPELEDANDQEVYISNRIAIQSAIETCKGIKPIVVASKSSGDQFQKMNKLTQAFSEMFINFEEDLKHLAYIYTQFDKNEEEKLRQKLVSIKEILDQSKSVDVCFKLVVEDMVKKSQNHLILLDPISDDRMQILKAIIEDNSYINDPKKHFKISLNEKARKKIASQMNKHFTCIEKCVLRKEINLALFKFNELISLKALIDEKEINDRFDDIGQNFIQSLSNETSLCVKNLNSVVEENKLIESSIQDEYIANLKKAKEYEPIIRKLGDRSRSIFEELNENLIQQSKQICESLKRRNVFNEMEIIKLELNNLKKIMEIKLNDDLDDRSKKHEQELAGVYQEACDYINEKIAEMGDSIKASIDTNDLDKAAIELSKLKKSSEGLRDYSERFSTFLNFGKLMSEKMKNSSNESDKIFKKDEIGDDELNKIIEIDSYFHQVEENYPLHEHISPAEIETVYSGFKKKVTNFFESKNRSIKESLNLDDFSIRRAKNEFDSVQASFFQMKKLRESENIERLTDDFYADSLKTLTSLVKLIKNEIEQNVDLVISQKDDVNYDKLLNNLRILKKLNWIESYKKNLYKNALSDIEEDILENLENLQRSLKEESFSIENHSNVEKIYGSLKKIFSNEPLEEIFPEVEKIVSKKKKWLNDELQREFKKILETTEEKIKMNVDKSEINYDFIEQSVSFIEACKIIPDVYKPDWRQAQEKVQTLLKKRLGVDESTNKLEDELDESIDFISQANVQTQSEATEKARKINNFFLEIEAIKQNYRKTSNYLPSEIKSDEFLSKWTNKINLKYDELERDIETNKLTENFDYLNDKLACVKAFSKLEGFLKDSKFRNLFNKYNIRSKQDSKLVYETCKEMIENLNFENLAESSAKFNISNESDENYLKNIKVKLNNKLRSICKDTSFNTKIVENLDEKMLQNIEKNFECILSAKKFVPSYIENMDEINQFENEIKDSMNKSVLKYLDGIEESIKKLDINLGEQKIQHILNVRQFIELYIEESTLSRINNLRSDQKSFVLSTVENFKNYDIGEYAHHSPKEIFAKLEGEADFDEAMKILKKVISEKFHDRLDQAKQVKPPSLENEHLKKCEKAMNYLPDNMKSEIQSFILEAKKDIEKNILSVELDLLSQLNNSDYGTVLGLLKNVENQNQTDHIKIIKDFVLNQKNAINQELSKSFASKNVNEILTSFEKFESLNNTFGEHFPNLQNDFTNILAKLKALFNESHQSLVEVLTTKNARANRTIKENESNLNANYEIVYRINQIDNKAAGKNIFMNSPETLFSDKYNQIILELQK